MVKLKYVFLVFFITNLTDGAEIIVNRPTNGTGTILISYPNFTNVIDECDDKPPWDESILLF